jgi:hypothetical protein
VQKGLASPALLDTYSEERLRVIAQMLKVTTELYNKTFGEIHGGGKGDDDAWRRGGDLSMLGVNYCGSSIVLEDDAVTSTNAYSKTEGGHVLAAYRAPDASGLVRAGTEDVPTRLFAIFSATVHTVLLFGGDEATRARVTKVLARLPKDTVRAVCVLPQGQTVGDRATVSTLILEDRAGHAYAGYGLTPNELTVVVVRPDGVVGAVVSSAEGAVRYFQKILL